jgi:CTP synthase
MSDLHDAYLSIIESLNHAGFSTGATVNIKWIDSGMLQKRPYPICLTELMALLSRADSGNRGIEGKITACRYARENDIPYLGICLGMQIAVIEYSQKTYAA